MYIYTYIYIHIYVYIYIRSLMYIHTPTYLGVAEGSKAEANVVGAAWMESGGCFA